FCTNACRLFQNRNYFLINLSQGKACIKEFMCYTLFVKL
ncbi:hypothetical protein A5868_001281, partial [Enterococcus sp. 12F9_DIV0723]